MPIPTGFLALLLDRLLTPRPTHEVLGLPVPISDRLRPTLEAAWKTRDEGERQDYIRELESMLAGCLAERGVPAKVYHLVLDLASDIGPDAWVVRKQDGIRWSLAKFNEFIDLGLHPRGADTEEPRE